MTRKDYIAIAGAFAELELRVDDGTAEGVIAVATLASAVLEVSLVLKRDNGRFDIDRFKRAALPRMTSRLDTLIAEHNRN